MNKNIIINLSKRIEDIKFSSIKNKEINLIILMEVEKIKIGLLIDIYLKQSK